MLRAFLDSVVRSDLWQCLGGPYVVPGIELPPSASMMRIVSPILFLRPASWLFFGVSSGVGVLNDLIYIYIYLPTYLSLSKYYMKRERVCHFSGFVGC